MFTDFSKLDREARRQALLAIVTAGGRARNAGTEWAATLLHVSGHTVTGWLKPETARSSGAVPLMAIELLERKAKEAGTGGA